ncbi:MAG: methyltransferase domain-containing protein [Deltaproteobacteria bacterium]|nr:methyltransferase domain-containing protein [Nannocystaceae bacterium]
MACRTSTPPGEPPDGDRPHPHHAHTMQHRFEHADEWVARFDDPDRDAWQKPDAVIATLGLRPDDVVADVGAGTGYFTVRLARAVPDGKVYASDVEPDMVRHIGERAQGEGLANVTAVLGGADDPSLPEPVDVVLMVDVLHHVDERPAFFRTLAAALDEGGRVVVVDFKPDAPEDGPGPPRQHRLAIAEIERDAASAGLRASVRDVDTLQFQYVLQLTR